jgi:hypothetical protein
LVVPPIHPPLGGIKVLSGCELVRYAHRYLVVPEVRIEKIEGFTPNCRIDYLIYARQRKRIIGTCLVKTL